MKTHEITEQILAPQITAVVRGELAAAELGPWLAKAYRAIQRYLRDVGVEASGPPFARFTFLDDLAAVEAGFPIATEIGGDGRVEPSILPGGPVAITTHVGRYEELPAVHAAVPDWLDSRGYTATGPHWEIYYSDPDAEPDASRLRTDLVTPYRVR